MAAQDFAWPKLLQPLKCVYGECMGIRLPCRLFQSLVSVRWNRNDDGGSDCKQLLRMESGVEGSLESLCAIVVCVPLYVLEMR